MAVRKNNIYNTKPVREIFPVGVIIPIINRYILSDMRMQTRNNNRIKEKWIVNPKSIQVITSYPSPR